MDPDRLVNTFKGHSGRVLSVALAPDGAQALSAAEDSTLKLWDLEAGGLIRTLRGHTGPVHATAIAPGGRVALSGSEDHTLRLWDLETGNPMRSLEGVRGTVYSATFAEDGKSALTGDGERSLRLWDLEEFKLLRVLKGHTAPVWAVAMSSDGRRALSGSGDKSAKVWDLVAGKVLRTLGGHIRPIRSVAMSSDGQLGLTASMDNAIKLWELETGKLLRTFEGHTGRIYSVVMTPDGRRAVSVARDSTLKVWDLKTGRLLDTIENDAELNAVAIAPDGRRAVTGDDGKRLKLWELAVPEQERDRSGQAQYVNAKVVLVGDSGVGKSGLRVVLTGKPYEATTSTHGRHVDVLGSNIVPAGDGIEEEQECLLWDLAGQPGYRLIHQLQLREVSVALVVFDAKSSTDPFAGVRHWTQALAQARRIEGSAAVPLEKFLVLARSDRGGVPVSRDRLSEFVSDHGFDGFVETSAKTGLGVEDLRELIMDAIPWEELPRVTSSELFESIKNFLLDQRDAGEVLCTRDTLFRSFLQAHPALEGADLEAHFNTCIGRLEARGLVRRLEFGGLVLMQPEMLDSYASFIVEAAKSEPDGLGSIAERRVLEADFRLDAEERIEDKEEERLLLLATVEDLLAFEIALREPSEDGMQLVFPSQLTRENPALPDPPGKSVVIRFKGPLINIYATLTVRLSHSGQFESRELWRNSVVYDAKQGGECGLYLRELDEGEGEIGLYHTEDTSEFVRMQFEQYVLTHLERHALPDSIVRRRVLVCPDPTCATPVSDQQVTKRRSLGKDYMICPVCDTRLDLREEAERQAILPATDVVEDMDASADAERDMQTAVTVLQGKVELDDFDVFLCHNSSDRLSVKAISDDLRLRGILPWLNVEQLRPGLPWQRELERQISKIKTAAVFVGEAGIGPWQEAEQEAFLREFVRRTCPVIPIILPGAPERHRSLISLRSVNTYGGTAPPRRTPPRGNRPLDMARVYPIEMSERDA